jgi:hypothetical protein
MNLNEVSNNAIKVLHEALASAVKNQKHLCPITGLPEQDFKAMADSLEEQALKRNLEIKAIKW